MLYRNLGVMLAKQAEKVGDKPLVYFNNEVHSYSTVNSATCRVAWLLESNNVKKGDKVAILMENSPQYVYSLFAIFKAGAIAVPINNLLTSPEVAYVLNDCDAKVLFISEKYGDQMQYFQKSCKKIVHFLAWGENTFGAKNVFEAVKCMPHDSFQLDISLDDLAIFLYTSGTTGYPKGAMLTHGNILTDALYMDMSLKIAPNDKFLLGLPMFHAYALIVGIIFPIFLSCSIVALGSVMEMKTKKFHKILLFKRPRVLLAIPQVYQALSMSSLPKCLIRLTYPVKLHISGGSAISDTTLNAFKEKFGVPIYEGYGLSEAAAVVSFNSFEMQKAYTVGPVLPGIQAKIVDNQGKELPLGEIGELIIKGGNIMKGYWKMPKETAETVRNGWLFTGDLAKLDEDYFITLIDRKVDLIKTKEASVYPSEVESIILTVAGVQATAVVGIPGKDKYDTIVAFVKLFDCSAVTSTAISDHLKDKLAPYKIPKHIHIMSELPKTATGKILKYELRRQYINGELKTV